MDGSHLREEAISLPQTVAAYSLLSILHVCFHVGPQ